MYRVVVGMGMAGGTQVVCVAVSHRYFFSITRFGRTVGILEEVGTLEVVHHVVM